MKIMRLFLALTLLFVVFNAQSEEKSEDFVKAKQAFTKAVESHNYRDAKSSLQELLPLMKSDIKGSKKSINALKKEGDATLVKQAENDLERKEEIYKSLSHLVDVSPAALRVKASQILELVVEFDELVGEEA